jgi:2,3-bisphosphoglycerate-independent phosphoglycerate mutase
MLVLRGPGLDPRLGETDPQATGVPPRVPEALDPAATRTAEVVTSLLDQAKSILAAEPRVHVLLTRGWAGHQRYPSFEERYGLRAVAHAKYPMYRGVAVLCGMHIEGIPGDEAETVDLLEEHYADYDFHFLHFKDPDSRGHDGDFEGKARAIESVDALVPRILALDPDVLVVTGDHSTPTVLGEHSWHGVPLLIRSKWARPGEAEFGEGNCQRGELGVIRGTDILPLALAHAGRLEKYGA